MPSPFIPSHKRRFRANKTFVGREKQVGIFLAAFEPPPAPDSHRVIVFYGVGGEGKTALVRHLLSRLEAAHAKSAGWAAVNFEDAALRRPAEGLLSVRLQLRKTACLPFPTFDTAFAQWFSRSYPGADIRQRHPELFRSESELGTDAYGVGLDVLKDMSELATKLAEHAWGIGLFFKYGARIHNRLREWWEQRGKERLAGIEALQPDELLERLPMFLGADIADAITAMPARKPLAILCDTMEAFHRGEAQQGGGFVFRNDRWLRELVKETPGVLFVLLGRDKLRWEEVEPEWAQVLEQHRLGALSPKDAEKFLLDVPVEEPAIRARMVEGAKGLPFYLDLQVDLYESLKNQGRVPEPAQFGGSQPKILGRFLDHLGQAASQALTVLAHGRRFNEALWLHLGREIIGGLPQFAFGELRGFSFVEELDGGWLSLHALMREELCARTAKNEPMLHEQVHRCLFAWWDERCQPEDVRSVTLNHELALADAALHREAFERETYGDWAVRPGELLLQAARYSIVQILWEIALVIEKDTLGKDHPKIARTLGNLGELYRQMGRIDEAIRMLRRVVQIEKLTGNFYHPEFARSLQMLGNCLREKGHLDLAENYLKQAHSIMLKYFGSNHPSVARVLMNLGNVMLNKKNFDAAERYQDDALTIFEHAFDLDHPDVARALASLGNILQLKDDLAGAQTRQERALAIQEHTLGPKHPDVATTLFNLSIVEERLGSTAISRKHRVRALAIFRDRLGEGHPDTETVRRALETINANAEGQGGGSA